MPDCNNLLPGTIRQGKQLYNFGVHTSLVYLIKDKFEYLLLILKLNIKNIRRIISALNIQKFLLNE